MNIIQRLAQIADRIDAKGLHSVATQIDDIIATQEMEIPNDSTTELENLITGCLEPLDDLIKVANELDHKGLLILADKVDKMIELEALKTQSAIDAILSIYKMKHKVASIHRATWEDEGDPSEAADWWKQPQTKDEDEEEEEPASDMIISLIGDYTPASDSPPREVERHLNVSTENAETIEDWRFYPFLRQGKIVSAEDGINEVLNFIRVQDIDEVVEVDADAGDSGEFSYTSGQVLTPFLNYIGDRKGKYLLFSDEPNTLRLSFIPERLTVVKHEKIEEPMPGEIPDPEELEKWLKAKKLKSFCKRAGVRKDNTEERCPFGLPIPDACKSVGVLVREMEEDDAATNNQLFDQFKPGQQCSFAAEVLEDQKAVNCNYGTPLAGIDVPELYHGSPIYPKLFEGFNTVNLDRSYQPTDFSNYSIYGKLKGFTRCLRS